MLDDPYTTISLVGLVVFGLYGLLLLYRSWRFMSLFGANPRAYRASSSSYSRDRHQSSRRQHRGSKKKNDKDLRKQYQAQADGGKGAKKHDKGSHSFGGRSVTYINHIFHVHLINMLYGSVCILFALFYLLQFVNVLWYQRANADSTFTEVNPYRWFVLRPLAGIVVGIMSSMFVNHYLADLAIVGFLSAAGHALLGVALILPISSLSFWMVYGIGAGLAAIAVLFLWGRESMRASRMLSVLYFCVLTVASFLLFLADSTVLGWLSFNTTLIMYGILDVLVILPAIVIPLQMFYDRYGIPLFPLMLYEAYGLGHLWRLKTSSELHRMWPVEFLTVVVDHKHHGHHNRSGRHRKGGGSSGGNDKDGSSTKVEVLHYRYIGSHCNLCGQTLDVPGVQSDADFVGSSDMIHSANKKCKQPGDYLYADEDPSDEESSSSSSSSSSSDSDSDEEMMPTNKKSNDDSAV